MRFLPSVFLFSFLFICTQTAAFADIQVINAKGSRSLLRIKDGGHGVIRKSRIDPVVVFSYSAFQKDYHFLSKPKVKEVQFEITTPSKIQSYRYVRSIRGILGYDEAVRCPFGTLSNKPAQCNKGIELEAGASYHVKISRVLATGELITEQATFSYAN